MIDVEQIQAEVSDGNHLAVIQRVFDGLNYGRAIKAVYVAYGSVVPAHGATVSQSPRLVIGVSGKNMMLIPVGDRVIEITLLPYEAVFISGEAWNLPLQKSRNTFMTLDFSQDYIRYYCRVKYPGEERSEPRFMIRRFGQPEKHILQTTSALETLSNDYGVEATHAAWGLMSSLIRQAFDALKYESATAYTTPAGRWEIVREFIEDHLHEPITRDDAAAEIGVHPNHLSRLVKRFSGMAYIKYLNERRLIRAADLLSSYRLSVKEVGGRCGYATPAHFSNAFKTRYGCSPGIYRKQNDR